MAAVESAILWVHIAAGVIALGAGTVALLTSKGGYRHRQAGKLYVGSMGIVVGSVVPLFATDPSDRSLQFLLLVAVFSGYLTFSGYRVLSRKRPQNKAKPIDWLASGGVILASVGLASMGGGLLSEGEQFGVVMLVFGLIGGAFGVSDVRTFRADEAEERITDHLSKMIGAFIATVTAVSAVNLTMIPAGIAWLWPTAAGVPLIMYWQRNYNR